MTINDVLWILCGVALVAMALISVLYGSGARTRSLDDIYARRDQRLGLGTDTPTAAPTAAPTAPVTSSAPTARPVTA